MWSYFLIWGTLFLLVSCSSETFLLKDSSIRLPCGRGKGRHCQWTHNKLAVSKEQWAKDYGETLQQNESGCGGILIKNFDPQLHTGSWECQGESRILKELLPSNITIYGSVELFEDSSRDFTCLVFGGSPRPVALQWILLASNGTKQRVLKEEPLTHDNYTSSSIRLVGKDVSLIGSRLVCRSIQIDHEERQILTQDEKPILISRSLSQTRSSDFQISSRYPNALRGKAASMILAKNKMSTFTCSTSRPWHVCQWKSPISNEPCGIFNSDDPRDCRGPWNIRESNDLNSTYNSWIVSKRSSDRNSCGISGLVTEEHEGLWNCEMQSKPSGRNDQYHHDQQYFEIKVIQVPVVTVRNMPSNIQMSESEVLDIKVDVSNAFPEPILRWTLNSEPFEPLILRNRHQGNSILAEYQYVAEPSHSGKRLSLEIVQTDDEGKEVSSRYESFLSIQPFANGEALVMGGGVIAAIVIGILAALLLCCILLLLLAFRRKKKDRVLVVKTKSTESGVMGTQTNTQTTENMGTMMDDLEHIGRRGSQERLLKEPSYSEIQFQRSENIQTRRLSLLLSPDEIEAYEYEGSGSRAESLSSLDSADDEPIFTFNSLSAHPKLQPLFDIYPFSDESDSMSISYEDSEV